MNRRAFLGFTVGSLAYFHPVSYGASVSPPPDLARRAARELREHILPFWLEHARDRTRGGFFGEISDDGDANPSAARGALLTARILWTFSAAYRRYRDAEYLDMARWAYDDLLHRFWDREHGGLYWEVSADGAPTNAAKLVYVQAFGIYGLAEFHRATADPAPLARATELFHTLEQHARDARHGGYFEEFSRAWQISRARGAGSPMGSLGQKSQNVHLHVMEAYATLYRAWGDAELRQRLQETVDVLRSRMLDARREHLGLFFNEDWTPRSSTISYGHDIEYSWLAIEAAEALGDQALMATTRREALVIAEAVRTRGVDDDGAVLAEGGPQGATNRFKEWWPQAEALVGFANAYQLSGDRKFLVALEKTWGFIANHLADREHGEWFHGILPDGKRSPAPKASFWKCPYHNGRACLELAARLG